MFDSDPFVKILDNDLKNVVSGAKELVELSKNNLSLKLESTRINFVRYQSPMTSWSVSLKMKMDAVERSSA